MSLTADGRDLGRLLSWTLRPKARPGTSADYTTLVSRYRDDSAFRTAFDALLDGLDMGVLHAGDLGIFLSVRRESVFAYRISDEAATWTKDNAKVLRGIAHLAVAAYAFPHPDDLNDLSVRYVDVMPLEAFIRRSCADLRSRAERLADGQARADDLVDLALAGGLDAAWALWDHMPTAEIPRRGRGAGRISQASTTYWVLRALKDLTDHGLAKQSGRDGDRYQLLDRFRHQVGTYAAEEGYRALAALRRADSELPDPRDPGEHSPLPGEAPAWAEESATNDDDDQGAARDEESA
jgi:hypothetical protein